MRIIISLAMVLLMASCQQGNQKQQDASEKETVVELNQEVLNIGKMHCDMCVASIEKGLKGVEGVEFVKVDLEDSTAVIRYDETKTNVGQFREVIEKRGYVLKDKGL